MTNIYDTQSIAYQQLDAIRNETADSLHGLTAIFGKGIIACHTTALKLLRIELPSHSSINQDKIHILTDRSNADRLPNAELISCHTSRIHFEPIDVDEVISAVPPVFVWWQMAAYLDWTELIVLGDSMMRGNHAIRRLSLSDFQMFMDKLHPNTPQLKKCATSLSFMRENTDSSMESRLRIQLARLGLGGLKVNAQVADPEEGHNWSIDLAWPKHHIGIEYDGQYHFDKAQVISDTHKRQRLRKAGWKIITVYAQDFYDLVEFGTYSDIFKTIISALQQASGKRVLAHEPFTDAKMIRHGDNLLLRRRYRRCSSLAASGNKTTITG
ncbi:hypothetical protein [Bifidobacterium sp. ESL0800]|uniref:endonuclease domain-containing protein n=1 Tax=Bifidobacterium sp. ESL0800 TaxID=2983236 RepID=UPI0023F625F3|nr:hypothetical protein [Bifidobacterium sp. ESL0800]WEV75083.1 hypothetical protein OZX75_05360 [Bifidobacterium sp. ESL0800]